MRQLEEGEEEGKGKWVEEKQSVCKSYCFRENAEKQDDDLIKKVEEEFWASVVQETKEIESREKKRQEAMMPKELPTPIPEEGGEQLGGSGEVTKVKVLIELFENGINVLSPTPTSLPLSSFISHLFIFPLSSISLIRNQRKK